MPIDSTHIGLRAQDIQTCLQDFEIVGPAAGTMDKTLLTGMAERLAIHLRGKEVLEDDAALRIMARQLGIQSLLLDRVLDVLNEVGYVSRRGKKLYESVPYYGNIYSALGDYWKNSDPHEIEQASISMLDELSRTPIPESRLRAKYSLDEKDYAILRQIGDKGSLFQSYVSQKDAESVVYSPVFWDENPEGLFEMLKRYSPEELGQAIARVQNYQGLPIASLQDLRKSKENQIIAEALHRGILPTPSVTSTAGLKHFVFTPYSGGISLKPEDKAILDKARAILACVRYGQHFATVTRINEPLAIINSLESSGKLGPHTEIRQQYFILWGKGLVRFAPDTVFSNRFWMHFVDTEENRKALSLARDMLRVGENITNRGLQPEVRQILFSGTYEEPLTSLVRRKQEITLSPSEVSDILSEITDRFREDI